MFNLSIVLVEDEDILRVSLTDELMDAGFVVRDFSNPLDALKSIEADAPDVVITDIRLPYMSGLELMKELKAEQNAICVIVMTAYGSVDLAVDAMKNGAYDFITKPFETEEILLLLERVAELRSIREENKQLQRRLETQYDLTSYVGTSPETARLLQDLQTVAPTPSTVLITGETGTGKELVANLVHQCSPRAKRPFISVSCAILSRDVIESELFGHEKGAFTGATESRIGRFEASSGGTIYLDDIDDIPMDIQVKLLRVLEERLVERVGGSGPIAVDLRVVASTKADLLKMVHEGTFREDLFYRLNVFPLHIAPLRSRTQDIQELIRFFSERFNRANPLLLSENVLKRLLGYSWPGNVRELRNVMERLELFSQSQSIQIDHLPLEIQKASNAILDRKRDSDLPLPALLTEFEEGIIRRALESVGGHQGKAAKQLGVPTSTLRTKMEKYGLI